MAKRIGLVFIVLLLLGGCSFKDIDKRLFVLAFGVDKSDEEEKPFHVSLKISIPSSESGGSPEKENIVLDAKGESITDAILKIRTQVDKELDFGHAKVIVFGKDILPGNLKYLSNWFFRQNDIQQITWVAVSDEKAIEVMGLLPKTVSQPSNGLVIAFEQTGAENAYIFPKYLFQYRREYFDEGVNPVLPVIKVNGEQHSIEKSAVITENGDVINLNKEETQYINLLNQQMQEMYFKVKLDNNRLTITTQKISSSYKMDVSGKTPSIQFSINLTCVIDESFEEVSDKDRIEVESKLKDKVNKNIKGLLEKFQKENVDPLGFGINYRSKQWNDQNSKERWRELYPQVAFKVDTKVNIKSTGLVQ